MSTENNYHAALAGFRKITPARYRRWREYFGDVAALWQANLAELRRAGLEREVAEEFVAWRRDCSVAAITEQLAREGISTVSLGEPRYPRLLAEIADPPHTLFVRGALPGDAAPAVAVVGTRTCSPYGIQITEELTRELVTYGVAVVSGLAFGIDSYAHHAAVRAGGKTIAVLGSGVDQATVHPAAHQPLAEEILAQGGALVSEYPPGFKPTAYSFPERNRIIAGLSLGVLVTEAPAESGALITAKCALDYNREVFAVPHPITAATGVGSNNLIKMGAKLVTAAADVLEELRLSHLLTDIASRTAPPATPEEAKLLPLLSRTPVAIDVLVEQSGLSAAAVSSALVMLELKGQVRAQGGLVHLRHS
ncbi:MAG: DNA-protecting protein DprA [Candidatus Magasanikbacteria bacterium]|nr:DNA-protecting protein DprA [Candidatus Magasanikbacteria bacterium]